MHEDGQRAYETRIADEFIEDIAHIWSPRLLDHIRGLVGLLRTNPGLGSPRVRRSLKQRYGDNLRTIAVSNYAIVYRLDGEVVDVLAAVHGPGVT